MSVLIKGLNIKPCKDGFDGKGLVIIGYDDKLYAVAHEQIIPLPDDATIEPKKGKWESDEFLYTTHQTRCSNCKTEFYVDDLLNVGEGAQEFLPNYCPHCGADMRGEADEHTD